MLLGRNLIFWQFLLAILAKSGVFFGDLTYLWGEIWVNMASNRQKKTGYI